MRWRAFSDALRGRWPRPRSAADLAAAALADMERLAVVKAVIRPR